jgi:hypothetical protein
MKNGVRKLHERTAGSLAATVLSGLATLGAAIFVLRSLPELIRYMRARRM